MTNEITQKKDLKERFKNSRISFSCSFKCNNCKEKINVTFGVNDNKILIKTPEKCPFCKAIKSVKGEVIHFLQNVAKNNNARFNIKK